MISFRRNVACLLICLIALNLLRASVRAQQVDPGQFTYDIVIRNGRVLDGAGDPWILADVAIKDGRFARIGKVLERGRQEIDASGRYVSPGWIDVMDQSGRALTQNGLAENKLMMGVTTAIGGEGGTPVPADKISDYFAGLEKTGISINFGTYFSETQARVAVLAQDSRAPTPEELQRMKVIMETAMKAGAMGMTTALIYPPSSYASTNELIEVAKVAGQYGGIYASHIRGEGKELVQSIEEAITISEKGGLPVEIFHLKAAFQPGWGRLMRQAEENRKKRERVVSTSRRTCISTPLAAPDSKRRFPPGPSKVAIRKLLERLKNPATRTRLKREMVTGSPGWWNIIEAAGGWDGIVLANAKNPDHKHFEGKSLTQIAKEWKKNSG